MVGCCFYNTRNQPYTTRYDGKFVSQFLYDNGNRNFKQNYGNGNNRTITYGRQDNLRTSDITKDGTQTLDDLALSYTYAADKQITAETIIGDLVQSQGFTATYDPGNRITTHSGMTVSVISQTWNYDNSGNWNSTTKTINNTTTTEARNHNNSDQITSIAGNAATHDLRGNLTDYEINGKNYEVEYDLDNRIIKVEVDNDDVEYRYDALGRRVIRKEGSTKSALIWWGNSECAEHKHQAGQTVIQNDIMAHPTRLNSVIARAVDGSKFKLEWYHKNYLDHVYAVSDDGGDLIEHYRYSAFGEVTIYDQNGDLETETQIENTILWNTRRRDEVTGYYLYKYRHYDPALGRWPSRDPIEEYGGVNLYGFVNNQPTWYWDYLGTKIQTECDISKKLDELGIIYKYTKLGEHEHLYDECELKVDQEIIRTLIIHEVTFKFKGKSIDDAISSIMVNVNARKNIRKNAIVLAKHLTFSTTPYMIYQKDEKSGDSILLADKSGTSCLGAVKYLQSSDHLKKVKSKYFIPGDRGYIYNLKHEKYGGTLDKVGIEGENLIYMGNNLFYGHIDRASGRRFRSLHDWTKFVNGWGKASLDKAKFIVTTGRDFTLGKIVGI